MDFGTSEEQELLRAELRKFLDQNCPLEEVRKLAETPAGYSRHLWERMAELGWVGLTLPEEHGGVGLGWVDLAVVLEETGRTLFPSPLVASVLAATAIESAGDAAQRARWLPGLARGASIGSVALLERSDDPDPAASALAGAPDGAGFALRGEKILVADAQNADLFVVAFRAPQGPSLGVLERGAQGVAVVPQELTDPTRRAGRLVLDGARVSREALLGAPGAAAQTLERLWDCGAVAVVAEAVGAAEAALALTVDYAKTRIQFGQPIGRFQGVKHPLAEMAVQVESMRSLLTYAAWLLDRGAPEAPLAVSRAKAFTAECFPRIGLDCIQLHGAIGYTWECDAQLYLKRARGTRPAFGDAAYHYERIARLGGL
jgi:alkylation response protein AidB-like acyl-CoA dehydrogenase